MVRTPCVVIPLKIMIGQDTKRVEREDITGNAKIVAFPESDLEERGSYCKF